MGIIASGQITLTDLSDAPVLSAYITADKPTTQVYTAASATYNPSFTTSPLNLKLNLTRAGTTESIVGGISGEVSWVKVVGGVRSNITTTNTEPDYVSGTKNVTLTSKVNVPNNEPYVRYEATGTWQDPSTNLLVPFSAFLDITLLQTGESATIINVYTPNGNIFYNNDPATLKVQADMYKGGSMASTRKQFEFFVADSSVNSTSSPGYDPDGGLGWKLCSSTNTPGYTPSPTPSTTVTNQGTLTVAATAVTNSTTVKCVITDVEGGNGKYSGVVSIIDFTDPITIIVESSAGDVFKNGAGATTLTARLYRRGEEIDESGTEGYIYKWSKRDQNGILDSNFGGTGNQYKTGKRLTVIATDFVGKSVYICEVEK